MVGASGRWVYAVTREAGGVQPHRRFRRWDGPTRTPRHEPCRIRRLLHRIDFPAF